MPSIPTRYHIDHLTGATLAHNGQPETAGRCYSNHRELPAALRRRAKLQLGDMRNFVIVDSTTNRIVDHRDCELGRQVKAPAPRAKPRKITVVQRRMLGQLMDARHGCAAVSDWTNGMGRHTTRKATPIHCAELSIDNAMFLPGLSGKQARALHKARPRVQRVIIVTNRRAANRDRA